MADRLAAQLEFGAKIIADNLHALTVLEAEGIAKIKINYKINRAYAFSHLKRCMPRWLLIALPTSEQLLSVLRELAKNLIRFLPGESKPRPPPSHIENMLINPHI